MDGGLLLFGVIGVALYLLVTKKSRRQVNIIGLEKVRPRRRGSEVFGKALQFVMMWAVIIFVMYWAIKFGQDWRAAGR